ncbi:MAG: 3-dehydroquinate synthase [Oscillospiraceae bacterium]|jgi:3-dehydroquinate synthase|nr:3-dehydroquinate synthase [Oscillospiraceae bacterium]
MKIVNVPVRGKDYKVTIGRGAISALAETIASMNADAVCIAADTNTVRFAPQVRGIISGISVYESVIVPGEEHKTPETVIDLCRSFARYGLTRQSVILALGGGVTGDAAGFAASCYMRGIRCVQIPTTLIAMTDSSVGGKTGVDLPEGKNLFGAFHQPDAVIAELSFLDTLPEREIRAGLGEMLKYYGIGAFPHSALDVFPLTGDSMRSGAFENVASDCVAYKARAVAEDEFDTGVRRYLNLGHSFGHALEKLCGFKTYNHGEAVAVGTVIALRAGVRLGVTAPEALDAVLTAASKMGLDVASGVDPAALLPHMLSDKKNSRGVIRLVILKQIGEPLIYEITESELRAVLEDL